MREIDRGEFELFAFDVLPDVEFRPVRDRENADVFALETAGVIEIPQLGALILRVPLTELEKKKKNALLGTRLFLVAPGAADTGVETEFFDGFKQRHRLVLVA